MNKRVETKTIASNEKEEKGNTKVILKCNYDVVDDEGKVETKNPNDPITLPAKEANRLIGIAFAVKA